MTKSMTGTTAGFASRIVEMESLECLVSQLRIWVRLHSSFRRLSNVAPPPMSLQEVVFLPKSFPLNRRRRLLHLDVIRDGAFASSGDDTAACETFQSSQRTGIPGHRRRRLLVFSCRGVSRLQLLSFCAEKGWQAIDLVGWCSFDCGTWQWHILRR